ncbi:MAG TPA: hypothetical protein PLM07_11535 [Candidatus Rifleibacterium sp.]|nr:hypothetical protein [Candidatus Rifleibacterium sp.]HPT46522.1 hypothetical protein [Candidatus Rifleibacterium sp.]
MQQFADISGFGESTRYWLLLSFAGKPVGFTTGIERLAPFFKNQTAA